LREAIFDKILPAIGSCKHLIISPDGELSRLSFEVLPNGDDGYLIDDFQISYLGAGRDLLRFDLQTGRQPGKSLVIADPDFDLGQSKSAKPNKPDAITNRCSRDLNRADLHFGHLPGTKVEGKTVSAQLRVKPWLRDQALEGRLKQYRSPHILHFATHGFFLEDQQLDPNVTNRDLGAVAGFGDQKEFARLSGPVPENPLLRSGLALAGVNTWLKEQNLPVEAEDGILTAEDVTGLDLLDTELVVLSACETGLGEIRTGEGVFGLRRSFVLAGASTLVMSLWKVPDKQTQELMEEFYRRILKGEPRAEALKNAQMHIRSQYPHPFYWGAFICQGDPGPLQSTAI